MYLTTSTAILATTIHLVSAGVLIPRDISTDNSCGTTGSGGSPSAFTCPTDLPCCSVNGWCGSTDAYCLASNGCQSGFGTCNTTTTTSDGDSAGSGGECGPGKGNCIASECCSLAGFCGTGPDFCKAPDCQFNFGPACDANAIPAGTNTSSIPRTKIGDVLYGSAGIYDCAVAGDMALTFDDGPYIYTSHILDLLKEYNSSATFFVTGNNNGKGQIDNISLPWPALLQRMNSEGHQIASHTWSHADLCNITSTERKNEMFKSEMAIRNVIGSIPTYMRPPYSSCTAECGCEADMEELGYHITYFDLDTSDYLNDSPTLISNSKTIFDAALAGKSSATDDFLVIGHDIHNQTSEVLVEYMLQGMQREGYRGVTVGECLGDARANWYRVDGEVVLGSEGS
ncbi:Glycoside hydrolase/deacetylase [Glarea lozoyensis ATCC 20868]|uniref:Glycoside hydrolase/deacetylase n=1 Tax=Glarea lozoyensis (strain ATCC 20868 / MF5171) TaxID=1116229 RepID=S3DHQ5_GLAL2|nr:Glycoside hydrolase/deacetylase [Glarea lozoyensis ATCC 20868]EPE31571.1 Glycoside hydrolase/deacetylase [Glarea lozoyensis ATCC 20868]